MRNNSFFTRLKAAIRFLLHSKNCRIMTCGQCGETSIVSITKEPISTAHNEDNLQIDLYWSEFVMCSKCGAACQEIQMWNFDGNVRKISKTVKLVKE